VSPHGWADARCRVAICAWPRAWQRARLDGAIGRADDRTAWLLGVKEALLAVYFGAIAAVFAARAIRAVCGPQRATRRRKRSGADPTPTDIPETAKATERDVVSQRRRNLAAPAQI